VTEFGRFDRRAQQWKPFINNDLSLECDLLSTGPREGRLDVAIEDSGEFSNLSLPKSQDRRPRDPALRPPLFHSEHPHVQLHFRS
jgi:hypothetical protein